MLSLRRVFIIGTMLFQLGGLAAQVQDSSIISIPESDQSELLEDYIQERELDDNFDFNTLFEDLVFYKKKPINLNNTDEVTLRESNLFNDLQINALKTYLNTNGPLISIYELQAIPYFNLNTIKKILPYVGVKGSINDTNTSIIKMLHKGSNELYIRGEKVLEEQIGFTNKEILGSTNFYQGIPYKVYTRFKHSYENKLSYGLTLENDAGEEFFSGSNKNGFDYASAHFYLRDYNSFIKTLALGDFTVSFGQGLIVHSGFGRGKSSQTIDLKKNRRVLKPYTSVDENLYNRGAGINLGFGKFEMTLFGSSVKRDANILAVDSIGLEEEELEFSSLQTSGLHRTAAEIIDEDAITLNSVGLNLSYKINSLAKIGFNGLYSSFDSAFDRNIKPYNLFAFNNDKLINGSVDYSFIYRNFHFFGETAISDNGGLATFNTLLMGLNQKVFLAIAQRDYSYKYQALNANAFGETSSANNERGVYLGLEIQPNYHWKFSAYMDTWKHPWLRFGIDAPSVGKEYLFKIKYRQKRKLEVYLQYRREIKERNNLRLESKTNVLGNQNKENIRFHVSNKINKTLELRNRIDLTFLDFRGSEAKGILVYQDIILKPKGVPISLTARLAYFDTDNFASRAFSYENDLLYSFSVPTYYNKGTRMYLNLRYRATRLLTLEGRIAQTHWTDEEQIGSALNLIDGDKRTDVKVQVRLKF